MFKMCKLNKTKTIILFVVCFILVFTSAFVIVKMATRNPVETEEEAITIATNYFHENFPERHDDRISVEKEGKNYIVHFGPASSGSIENGDLVCVLGGGTDIIVRESDGKVINYRFNW